MMNMFQLYAAYRAEQKTIEETEKLIRPLLQMYLDRADELTKNFKELAKAFDLHRPVSLNPAEYDVKWIQGRLAAAGMEVEATGKYDDQTKDAVEEYQQKEGLEVDGWVGPLTAERLEEVA